ncbi:LOW QUALITY PROTEIN: elongin-A3 member D-like [Mastomys coucha]|uniref:LOW QUALITY PROTEIN: elongin-A3 member D-like n=1 Tax=Mastomys coucha TaxID=35658 RepID=UPI00126249CC|nr:LOW QUALITY PROTEIN: elongin-A3 member D-like [Mastomys coucha]
MEAGSQAGVLQKLLDRLCQEIDQGKTYKFLKEMSSVPILCDSLAEIDFRQTIKTLKKHQLLCAFVKDLVAKWSPGFLPGTQPQGAQQDFGLKMDLSTAGQSNSPEQKAQEQASQEPRGDGREDFFGLSRVSSGRTSCLSPSRISQARSDPQASHIRSLDAGENCCPEQQLDGQNMVQVGTSRASLGESWLPEGAKPISRKPGERNWPVSGGPRKCQPQDGWEAEEAPGAGSLWPCLNCECCSHSSFGCPYCKRKRELHCRAEAQRPPPKAHRGESRSSKDPSPIASCAIAEKNHKMPVYSGFRPAARLQQKPHLGLLAQEPAGTRDVAHCQADKDKAGPGQPEEKSRPNMQTCKQTQSRPESPTAMKLQESQEERLQALKARIQSKTAKSLQARRRTMMISFFTQPKSPGQQGEPGPRGAVHAQNSHSLPESPAHSGARGASCLSSGERGKKKAPAQRPAPLMAKALREYRKSFPKK